MDRYLHENKEDTGMIGTVKIFLRYDKKTNLYGYFLRI